MKSGQALLFLIAVHRNTRINRIGIALVWSMKTRNGQLDERKSSCNNVRQTSAFICLVALSTIVSAYFAGLELKLYS